MANEHFFPGEYFSSSSGAAPVPYAPAPMPGLDVAAAMAAYGGMMPSWAVAADQMMMVPPPAADSAAQHFDSALSSLVSSPGGGGGGGAGGGFGMNGGAGDDVAIGDLIGRLGSICNGAGAGANNDSCYSTPLSSPPRCPPPFRAYAAAAGETGRLSRVSSSKSLGAAALERSEAEMNPVMPDPPPAKPSPSAAGEVPAARKRKSSAKAKASSSSLPAATAAAANVSPKRTKIAGAGDDGGDAAAAAAAEEEKPEKPEPPKDYIHVRARRGQATDSHSLAERVRRERISERMKLLQSLVPGCNKITGKALMLDEIINYVQSLQRQVEFLSIKLATMNPHLDFDGHYLPSKDMNLMSIPTYPSGDPTTAITFSYTGSPATTDPFGTYNCWELDLHAAMQMGAITTGLNHDTPVTTMAHSPSSLPHHPPPPHGFYGGQQQQGTTVNHMKAEP